jgi:hypothetical protein
MTTNSPSTIKLTDTQLVALSAASQRPDRSIAPPAHLKGGAIAKFAGGLIAKGIAEEIDADAGMAIIRRDGDRTFALMITATGLASLGIEQPNATSETATEDMGSAPSSGDDDVGAVRDQSKALAPDGDGSAGNPIAGPISGAEHGACGRSGVAATGVRAVPPSSAPREGTKLAQVIALLERAEGAVIGELMATTGWLAHTTRAALTGLRKRGYTVELKKGADGKESRYRITAMPIVAKAA